MAIASDIAGEEYYRAAIGQGMYTAELPSNIPDGYSSVCYNLVATGDSLENRIGIKRSSVDWRVSEQVPGSANPYAISSDDFNYFCQISPWGKDSTRPAFMWGSGGWTIPGGTLAGTALNLVRASGPVGTGDGFMSVFMPQAILGITQYREAIYVSLYTQGVHKITNINWTGDTLSFAQVLSSATGTLKGLLTFKDRIWGWNEDILYFTDLPTVGGYPETWAFAANRVVFNGPNGQGTIKQVVPLGNKLAVFTTNGLFTLLVEGAPASWILRVLDSRSISSTSQCAFETKGIIYYVNTQGVWATNCLTVTKLSAVIDDQWFLAKGARVHCINQYEDGMVVCIGKLCNSNNFCFDKEASKTFYSKLDPIGWTEWNVNSYSTGTSPYRLGMVYSMTDKVPTYLNAEPTVYVLALYTDSTEAAPQLPVLQLLIMDGGKDQYVVRANFVEEVPVHTYLKTKHFDGDNQYRLKRAKKCMVELFTSDAEHDIRTSWDIDSTTSVATEVRDDILNDFTVGVGSNLLQIQNQFFYRRASLNIRASLQTDTSQIKIKDIAIAQDTARAEFEQVR